MLYIMCSRTHRSLEAIIHACYLLTCTCMRGAGSEQLEFGVDLNAAKYVNGVRETPNGEVMLLSYVFLCRGTPLARNHLATYPCSVYDRGNLEQLFLWPL